MTDRVGREYWESRRRRARREILFVLLLLLGLLVGWGLWVRSWYDYVRPQGRTLADHFASHPEPFQYRVVNLKGAEHLVVFGPWETWPRFPSGHPVYVFDPEGLMVDWTSDEGDDNAFHGRCPGVYGGRKLTRAEAEAWPGAAK